MIQKYGINFSITNLLASISQVLPLNPEYAIENLFRFEITSKQGTLFDFEASP